jgi:3-dehydroquinate dehydratase-1
MSKPVIKLKDRALGGGELPLIICPLVGRGVDVVLSELDRVLAKKPDIVEWRADYFADIGSKDAVIGLGRQIKAALGDVPLLFTIRSAREGGQEIPIGDDEVVALHAAMCRGGIADIVDFELGNPIERLRQVRTESRASGTGMIMSYHNFQSTPPSGELTEKFAQAEQQGADVAKVAVMPQDLDDVLRLLSATFSASKRLKIPLISMSMGSLGSLSRLCGWMFGSTATFAVGAASSAPGQIAIDELRAALDILRRATATRT